MVNVLSLIIAVVGIITILFALSGALNTLVAASSAGAVVLGFLGLVSITIVAYMLDFASKSRNRRP